MHTESSPASASTSLGSRLRAARLAQDLSIEDVGARLKLPTAIVAAMERDDHAVLGAAVYARGRLGSYARLLGIPTAAVDLQFANLVTAPPPLVSTTRDTRFERSLQRMVGRGMYVALTAIIVLPVIWVATHHQLPQSVASLTTLDAPPVPGQPAKKPATVVTTSAQHNQPPVAASMAPFGSDHAASQAEPAGALPQATVPSVPAAANAASASIPASTGLQLRFSGNSWIELIAADGHVVEHGMVEAGSVRDYPTGAIARVMIGNTGSVMVSQNGQPLDITPFQHANMARFTLSSDGKPAPAGD
jgi:cytoskeleton protein RodZ